MMKKWLDIIYDGSVVLCSVQLNVYYVCTHFIIKINII